MIRSDLGNSYNNHGNTIQYFPTLSKTLSAIGGAPATVPPITITVPTPTKRQAGAESQPAEGNSKKPKASAKSTTTAPSASNADREAKAKTSGMLKLTAAAAGTNRALPKPSHILHANKSVCMNFCTQGFVCRNGNGRNCHYLHPAKLDDIPAPIRDTFAQWVTTQPSIEWVAGKGPAGTV
jgi:hypothetical protein